MQNCTVCGGPIRIMIMKNSGVCSGLCRKALARQQAALRPINGHAIDKPLFGRTA